MPGFGGSNLSPSSGNGASSNTTGNQGGTSFVLGGGGLRGRPAVERGSGANRQYAEDRYSFDPHEISCNGTSYRGDDRQSRGDRRERGGLSRERLTELELERSTKIQRIGFAIILYGVGLVLIIAALWGVFGGDSSSDRYTTPSGDVRRGRPMWAR